MGKNGQAIKYGIIAVIALAVVAIGAYSTATTGSLGHAVSSANTTSVTRTRTVNETAAVSSSLNTTSSVQTNGTANQSPYGWSIAPPYFCEFTGVYQCTNLTAYTNGKLSFVFGQHGGDTYYNVHLGCFDDYYLSYVPLAIQEAAFNSTSVSSGNVLENGTTVDISQLQCYNYNNQPAVFSTTSYGEEYLEKIWLSYSTTPTGPQVSNLIGEVTVTGPTVSASAAGGGIHPEDDPSSAAESGTLDGYIAVSSFDNMQNEVLQKVNKGWMQPFGV